MSLKIIMGPATSGKTNLICSEIVNGSIERPDERFIVITPEQASFQTQAKIIAMHPAHAALNIDVSSFEHLAYKVFAQLGVSLKNTLDDTGKALLIRKVINENKSSLALYASKSHTAGFADEMMSMITELIQYDINDDKLFLMQEAAADDAVLSAKIHDIRLIFEKFGEEIKDRYTTTERLLEIFAKYAGDSRIIQGANIYFDGFTGFTPIQYKAIKALMKTASSMTFAITLPANEAVKGKPEYDLFDLSRKTYFKLKEIAREENIEIVCDETTGESGNEIPGSDEQLLSRLPEKIALHKALNQTEEVEFIAKKIIELVRTEEIRYKDIAIICADTDNYLHIFKDVFERANLPVFIDDKSPLYDNPLSRFLNAAIALADKGFMYEEVFAFLKTGMSDVSANELCLLENYCLEFGIDSERKWKKDFAKNKKLRGREEFKWNLEYLNKTREHFIKSVLPFYKKMTKRNACVSDYADALLELFEDFGCKAKLKKAAEEFRAIGDLSKADEYDRVYELVTGLIEKTKELLGNTGVSLKDYSDIISAGLAELKVGIAPPALDALLVGDLIRTRLENTKVLFLAGANDGNIPKKTSGSIILTQKERELLKERTGIDAELAPTVTENIFTQRFYLHNMLSKPKERLYITCAALNSAEEEIREAYIFESVRSLRADAEIIIEKDENIYWAEDGRRKLALDISEYIKTGNMNEEGEALVKFFGEEEPEKLDKLIDAALVSNVEGPLDKETAEKLFGEIIKGSVSRFENFEKCAFMHFMKHGIRIERRPEYKIEPAAIGTIYHSAVEKYSKQLLEKGLSFENVNDAESHKIIGECVDAAVFEVDRDIFTMNARNEFLLKRIHQVAQKTTDVLRNHVKAGLFKPEYFELSFTSDSKEKLEFSGKIDRVDIYDEGDLFVKIIDYKSGKKEFSFKDIFMGTQLQLTAYLDEAMKKVGAENPSKKVRPGGIYYYFIKDEYLDEDKNKNKNKMDGLTNSDMNPDAIDKALKETKASSVVKIKIDKDGNVGSAGAGAEGEFENLVEFVEAKIDEAAEAIRNGCIAIEPLKETKDDTACDYCDYYDICKFEPGTLYSDFKDYSWVNKKTAREIINKVISEEDAPADDSESEGEN